MRGTSELDPVSGMSDENSPVSWEDMQNSSGEGIEDEASAYGSGGVKLNQAEGMVSAPSFRGWEVGS